jgi:hypothetical protein
METTLRLSWAVIALLVVLGFVGSAVLPGWLRRRRGESARRQIVLTDALDAVLGPIVAPVVTRPFWGPWRIEIAAPLARAVTVGRVLAVTRRALGSDGMAPDAYRVVLCDRPDSTRGAGKSRAGGTGRRWASNPTAA